MATKTRFYQMISKLIFVSITCLVFSSQTTAQITVKFGFKTGVAVGKLHIKPEILPLTGQYASYNYCIPKVSPVAGFVTELHFFKHIEVNTGIECYSSGYKEKKINLSRDYFDSSIYHTTFTYENRMNALVVPVMAGYTFKFLKLQHSVSVGMHLTRFFSGRANNSVYGYNATQNREFRSSENFKPLTNCYIPVQPFSCLMTFSAATRIGKYRIGYDFQIQKYIWYMPNEPFGACGTNSIRYIHEGSQLLTITRFF